MVLSLHTFFICFLCSRSCAGAMCIALLVWQRVPCITGVAHTSLTMGNSLVTNGMQGMAAALKPGIQPLQVDIYHLHRQIHHMISMLMQVKCHDVCRTTCRQQCMKPSWPSQQSLWFCLGGMLCRAPWRGLHKVALRSAPQSGSVHLLIQYNSWWHAPHSDPRPRLSIG